MPHNNATSLQVTAAVLGGVVWALENPRSGLIEADGLDHARVLEIAEPYLGDMVGAYSDWTPLLDRGRLFPASLPDRPSPLASSPRPWRWQTLTATAWPT